MGEYVDVGPLKTWFDSWGSEGPPLVLMHGGMDSNVEWEQHAPVLAEHFRVLAPERRGHGHTPDIGPITYDLMAEDTIGFLDQMVGGPTDLVGWSDGGIVGLIVAMRRPDLVNKLVAISANFDYRGLAPEAVAQSEGMTADAEGMAYFRSNYEAMSPDGPEHWPVVVEKIVRMFATEPTIDPKDLAAISAPTLVIASDDDIMTLEHTVDLYRAIPNSQLAIVPGTSHALVLEKPDVIDRLILEFLSNEPGPTMIPIRRAGAHG